MAEYRRNRCPGSMPLVIAIFALVTLLMLPTSAQAATSWREDWSAAGFFRWVSENNPNDWAANNDAEVAYNIVKYGTGSSYSGIQRSTDLSSRDDASSLLNMYRAVQAIEQCNEIRARHNAPPLKTNCQLMADSIVMCNVQLTFNGDLSHTRAYAVSENLAYWHTDPFKRWYDQEKEWYDAGARDYSVAHYENIVYSGYTISGFAFNTVGDQYSEQAFASMYDYRKSYTTTEFLALLETYMQKMADEQGMPLGTWIEDDQGWWYRRYDGTYPKNCITRIEGSDYCFDGSGYMVTGWVMNGSSWRYFTPGSGNMVSKQWVGDYYLGRDGVMLVNTTTPDGTKVDANGKRVKDGAADDGQAASGTETERHVNEWVKSGSRWWYRFADGSYPKSQFFTVDGATYYFDADGWMVTGWKQIGKAWYFFKGSGALATGWQEVNGSWYWLDKSSGAMATGWISDGSDRYYLNGSGAMATGWLLNNNQWYFLKGSGAMATGWQMVNGAWYWLDETSGAMATGWLDDNGKRYLLKESGAMATGWQKINDTWYWLDGSGALAHSCWIQGWYYVGKDGAMMSSGVTPDGYRIVDGKWDGKEKVA